jgi:NAD-dependent protein deacetylases, SIR2 family
MGESRSEKVKLLAELLKKASYPIAFTGAGISTESGIPDYRSPSTGVWEKMDPAKISVSALRGNPKNFGRDYMNFVASLENREPNLGHKALARLAELGYCNAVVTQNIDGLHQMAGSPRMLEVHGHIRTCRCSNCEEVYPHELMMESIRRDELPKSACCNSLLRTNVVLFGDGMAKDFDVAWYEAGRADFCLVLGSSLSVYPAAEVPFRTQAFGIINRDRTGREATAAVVIQGEIGEVMTELLAELEK